MRTGEHPASIVARMAVVANSVENGTEMVFRMAWSTKTGVNGVFAAGVAATAAAASISSWATSMTVSNPLACGGAPAA
jgi:thioredoxin reductase